MNKLQLYIYKSLRGFKSVRNINPAENVQRYIRDVRPALERVGYDPAEKNLFYLVSYIGTGSFFTIIRTIPDKPLDHLATTIYVPNGLAIGADEMLATVKRLTRMLSNPAVSEADGLELYEMFSKEYPADAEAPAVVASQGREYAVCRYGGSTGRGLEAFFGERLYQPGFLPYAGVLLVDDELGLAFDAPDLTEAVPAQTVALLPPEPSADGFAPTIYGEMFDRPFRVPLGSEVDVVWRRQGFEDRSQRVAVKADGQRVEGISISDSRKTIAPQSFYITSHVTKAPVADASVTVNGTEIKGPTTFTLDELRDAEIVVNAPGFAPYRVHNDLAASTRVLIQLQEMRKIYRFELPVKSSELGAPIHFEIHTKRELTDSPIEGYTLLDDIREGAGRNNHLAYTGGNGTPAWRAYAIGAAAGLIFGLLVGWLCIGSSGDKEDDEPTVITETVDINATTDAAASGAAVGPRHAAAKPDGGQPAKPEAKQEVKPEAEKPAPDAPLTPQALNYLEANSVWTQDGLSKFPELNGLFDDMNNFRLKRIVDVWQPRLSKSKRFERIAHHATESMRKKIFTPEGTYCKADGDKSITVQSYLNRIDPAKK